MARLPYTLGFPDIGMVQEIGCSLGLGGVLAIATGEPLVQFGSGFHAPL